MAKQISLDDLRPKNQPKRASQDPFHKVGVIGLGVMGCGIAETVANSGMEVVGVEQSEVSLKKGLQELSKTLDLEIKRWAKTSSEKRAILARIHGTTSLADLKECRLVVEAIDESYESKRGLFEAFFAVAREDAVLVSNTATLSMTKLAGSHPWADRIIGMHFIQPVPQVPVVEIIRAQKTSDTTYALVRQFAERIGKTPVEVFEYPGFITTRTILPMINEAAHILMEGVARAEDIDTAMKLGYGMQMGPLEMADSIGLDEVLSWCEQLFHDLGEARYRPCPLLRRMVRERRLGKKVGEGFFKYNSEGRKAGSGKTTTQPAGAA